MPKCFSYLNFYTVDPYESYYQLLVLEKLRIFLSHIFLKNK